MHFQNSRYLLRMAGPSDGAAIGKILESGSFPGAISVQFTRRPDAYQSFRKDGDRVAIVVAEDRRTGEPVAVGGCVLRNAYVNGAVQTIGYLTGMKVLEQHRGGRVPIREAYRLIHSQTKEHCSIYITTILSGNTQAMRLLEKPRQGMPAYRPQGGYTVFCLGTGRPVTLPKGLHLVQGHDGLKAFYESHLPTFQLAPASEWLHGLTSQDFYSLQTSNGDILAACAIWNQQDYKQYRITGYHSALRLARHLPTRLLGYPTIPKENTFANYASVALPVVREDAMSCAKVFLRAVAGQAGAYDFLMLGLMEQHPLFETTAKLPHVKYTSRLYTVEFETDTYLDQRPMMLETGLL